MAIIHLQSDTASLDKPECPELFQHLIASCAHMSDRLHIDTMASAYVILHIRQPSSPALTGGQDFSLAHLARMKLSDLHQMLVLVTMNMWMPVISKSGDICRSSDTMTQGYDSLLRVFLNQ